ncbi:MAG: AAA family ATPase, partial [Thermodesulfobacteriota bacterium]
DAALEIKSATDVGERVGGLHLFQEETACEKSFIVSREPRPRKIHSEITVLPWQVFCEMLWAGEII